MRSNLRNKLVRSCLITCHYGFLEILSLTVEGLKQQFRNVDFCVPFPDIILPRVQALGGITVIRSDDQFKLRLAGSQKLIPLVVFPSQPVARVGATGAIIIIIIIITIIKNHSSTIFNLSAPVSATLRSNYVITLLIPWNTFLFDRPTVVIISVNWK